jgi:hypothetical protein
MLQRAYGTSKSKIALGIFCGGSEETSKSSSITFILIR